MKSIALIGGGPSALLLYKRLVQAHRSDLRVEIFERKQHLGQGMPYSSEGANLEHITNVSGHELPDLVTPLVDWVRALPEEKLQYYRVDRASFHQEKVLPRLLFGEYLEAQFQLLRREADALGFHTQVHYGRTVTDLRDLPDQNQVEVVVKGAPAQTFDRVVVCSGHNWPAGREGEVPGYFASPYPPAKLAQRFNHRLALRGSSLTAVDAVRTLARHNGRFLRGEKVVFEVAPECPDFKIVMHTRNGMLPCVRFHLEDPQVTQVELPSAQDLERIRRKNAGFVPLDLIFEEYFKKPLGEKDPAMAERIRALSLEEFVEAAMDPRERNEPFAYFQAEYRESLKSLARRETIAWKEVLAVLSFVVNYPAKYFCAEDMLRLREVLLPLISIVIAFIPQASCEELMALHEAGRLELISVGSDSEVEIQEDGQILYTYVDQDGESRALAYRTYVDCVGQPHLPVTAFPFPSLVEQKVVRQARLTFRSTEGARRQQQKDADSVQQDEDGSYHLVVPGIAINDRFQPVAWERTAHPRIHLMAVPYMGGHNPDYSGLDFCEEASQRIVDGILADQPGTVSQ